jgi:hypothetical protein
MPPHAAVSRREAVFLPKPQCAALLPSHDCIQGDNGRHRERIAGTESQEPLHQVGRVGAWLPRRGPVRCRHVGVVRLLDEWCAQFPRDDRPGVSVQFESLTAWTSALGGELLHRLFLFLIMLIALFLVSREGKWLADRLLDTG